MFNLPKDKMRDPETCDEFLEDLCNLGIKYSERLHVALISYYLVRTGSRLFMDYAPTKQIARESIQDSVQSGINWHYEEQENKPFDEGRDE